MTAGAEAPLGRRPLRLLALVALVVAGAALAALRAADQRPGTDFYAKWVAGKLFLAGEPVYVLRPDVRGVQTYPPFAAMAFQVLALLPLKVAAGFAYFANLVLTVLAVVLTHRVFRRLWPTERPRWPLALAVVCTAQFYLNNLNLIQIDAFLFVLVLLGITAYLDGHDVAVAAAFVGATALKVIPVFFVAWLMVRGRGRAALAVIPLAAACVVLPILQRGVDRGVRDLKEYHTLVLAGVRRGDVNATYTNQNLAATLYRLTRPSPTAGGPDYRLVAFSESTTRAVTRVGALLVALAWLASLLRLRLRGEPVSVFEFASTFLVGNLLSPLTWKSHLVTLLFVAYAFIAIPSQVLPRSGRVAWTGALCALLGVGITGRDVVGDALHHGIGGYSIIGWMLLALFIGAVLLSRRRFRVWETAQPGDVS